MSSVCWQQAVRKSVRHIALRCVPGCCQEICITYTIAVCTVLLSGNLYNIYHCCVYSVAVRKTICHIPLLCVQCCFQEICITYSIAVYSVAVRKSVWHIPLLCVQRKTLDDGQRNCPKRVEFYSKNKFEKLVHLVGYIIGIITMHAHLNGNLSAFCI
jgi:hypothetical protein